MATTDTVAASDGSGSAEDTAAIQVPNSPSSAFAALSLDDAAPSTSTAHFTSAHLAEIDAATQLVAALDAARKQPKPLIRSTGHRVDVQSSASVSSGADHHHLLSWKVAEFAYRKATGVGSELPTLARGLFTERLATSCSTEKHRIVVRGYDKFFNLGEMPWTKPEAIARFTTAPYVLTFKENGCIIFIAALSPAQLVVTSKHSLGGIVGTEVTHAQKGHEWLLKHLASVDRTEQQLAAELWRRNETAAFELCDDTFEEHVLAYDDARSGLHLHGLNANAVHFATRPMPDVDAFAHEWGFIRTRWIELPSLQEVQRVTAEIEQTGAWDGEPIEGFVIRTHMPPQHQLDSLADDKAKTAVQPPYEPAQAWFYKVKFDEPYLMYRDWRELARKMLKEKQEWDAKVAAYHAEASDTTEAPPSVAIEAATIKADAVEAATVEGEEGEGPSKAALKREKKRLAKQSAKEAAVQRAAAQAAGILPPPPPQPRTRRPETLAFVEWCYDRLYGNAAKGVAAQPALFAGLAQNKGIIAMRNAFLSHYTTHAPAPAPAATNEPDTRPFSKTVLAPVAVPGCGKTVLAVALRELFGVGHVQSDAFKAKKGFLGAVERDLRAHAAQEGYVIFADKNNHLQQHRDDIVQLADQLSHPPAAAPGRKGKGKVPEVGRVRTVAVVWDLDALPLNSLHRVCVQRIEQRGDNHQNLVADGEEQAVVGMRTHEQILWKFLEALEPFDSAAGKGEGAAGFGDGSFDHIVRLQVQASVKDNLHALIGALAPVLGWAVPGEDEVTRALEKALAWKVDKKAKIETKPTAPPRYFGLAVELDVRAVLDALLGGDSRIGEFYTRVREGGRLNLRPHITLCHQANLDADSPGVSDARWSFYTSLLANKEQDVWEVTLSTLLYQEDQLLTFLVDEIKPPETVDKVFRELHTDWHPHITLATRDNDVRPYQANQVAEQWRLGSPERIHVRQLDTPVTVHARVFGMT